MDNFGEPIRVPNLILAEQRWLEAGLEAGYDRAGGGIGAGQGRGSRWGTAGVHAETHRHDGGKNERMSARGKI